jgi:hypothetical protein
MPTLTLPRSRPFKDYCLVLQVHPEADVGVVDAAYWHLAKRYSEEAALNPSARAKLEELNEAYSVLGSPDRREAYMVLRSAVLGEGALPMPPPPPPPTPPLAMMDRQRPVPRRSPTAESLPRFALPQLQSMLAICLILIAAVGALLAGAQSGAVVAFLALVLPLSALPLWRPRFASRPPADLQS